jgi:hypothetical protein
MPGSADRLNRFLCNGYTPPGTSYPEPTTDEVEEEQQLYESLLDKHIERKVNASLCRTLQQESRRGDVTSLSPQTGSSYGPNANGEAHQAKVTGFKRCLRISSVEILGK